ALPGREGGPPVVAPPGLPVAMAAWAGAFAAVTGRVGRPLAVDGPALLGERAALAGLSRHGDRSPGGATRLLPAADGWLALALARPEDVGALGAWLEVAVTEDEPWTAVAPAVQGR